MASDYAHIYRSYAEVLESAQRVKEDLAAVLDPEVGYAPRLRGVCQDL